MACDANRARSLSSTTRKNPIKRKNIITQQHLIHHPPGKMADRVGIEIDSMDSSAKPLAKMPLALAGVIMLSVFMRDALRFTHSAAFLYGAPGQIERETQNTFEGADSERAVKNPVCKIPVKAAKLAAHFEEAHSKL